MKQGLKNMTRPGLLLAGLVLFFCEFATVATQFPVRESEQLTRKVTIIQFGGDSFVQFDFNRLPPEYLQPAQIEEVQFYFISGQADGLIWLQEYRGRTMYLYMRGGRLVFVNDDGSGLPDEVAIGHRARARFDDGQWHLFKITRRGRRISLTVDGEHQEDYIFAGDIQFLVPATVFLGGTQNVYESTDEKLRSRFRGGLALILYKTETRSGARIFRNEVNLIAEIGRQVDGGIITGVDVIEVEWPEGPLPLPPKITTTTPPPPKATTVTIKDPSIFFTLDQMFDLKDGSSISFRFKTIKREGLLLYTTSNIYGRNFIALEIYDGKLYFIHNFGGQTKRTLLSESEVSDGQFHEVELKFFRNLLSLKLDAESKRIGVEPGEALPRSLGNVYVGGFSTYKLLPWHTWARTGYQGCIDDLSINGKIVDFYRYLQSQQLYGRVDQGCSAMPKGCVRQPCIRGQCIDMWGGYFCDCRGTDYTGKQCQTPSLTAVFNGTNRYRLTFLPQEEFHVNDISFRFKTMMPDGLIFHTNARNDGGFMRAELDNGRIKITTNLGGKYETFYLGENLNDMQWHTVYIQRRGNHMEMWVDDLMHEKRILTGENFYHLVDDIFIGGIHPGDIAMPDTSKDFVGYIRNFYFGKYDVFDQLSRDVTIIFYREPDIPPLVFQDVTFPTYDMFIRLPPLGRTSDLDINFLFKTHDANGVIFFNEGPNKEMFAIEIFEGRLHLKMDIPGMPPLRLTTPAHIRYDNGTWHYVSVKHYESEGGGNMVVMTVDGLRSTYSYSGLDKILFNGPLYIGGLPLSLFERKYVSDFLSSTAGFRGCLASVSIGSTLPNLYNYGQSQGVTLYNQCQAIRTKCTPTTCKNGGICHDHLNNGTTWCDCSMTGFDGPVCNDYPLGYYFRASGEPDLYGMIIYEYPAILSKDSERDEIVFGVMTKDKNVVLAKMLSRLLDDFIEIKLVDGYAVVTYDTAGQGTTTVGNNDVYVSDGNYHIIRFVRTKGKGELYVDKVRAYSNHFGPHDKFDRMGKIFIGGVYQGGEIVQGTGLHGIIGGMYVNGLLVFPHVRDEINSRIITDVKVAPIPYKLGPIKEVTSPPWEEVQTTLPPTELFPDGLPIIPSDVGGAGIGWALGPGGAVDIVVFPDGSGGSGGTVPGGIPTGAGGRADPLVAMASVPSLPITGPRAGAVMGTLLGLAALASSLMWAFYRCKPGWCGTGPAPVPLNISTPRATSNMAAVKAATASSGAAGAGADADFVDAPAGGTLTSSGYNTSTYGTGIGRGGYGSTTTAANYSESNMVVTPGSLQSYNFTDGHADYDVATGVHGGFSSATMSSNYNYSVKTIKTVGGQQQMMGYAAGSHPVIVTPGAMGEEIRVDCCLMTGDGHSVVTGSSLGPPQVWNMSNGELLRIMQGETVGSTNLHLALNDRLLVGAINSDLEVNQYSVPKGVHNYVFQIWDFASGRPLDMAERETCSALTMMSDNDKVVFGRSDKFGGGTNIIVWDLLGNQAMKEMRYDAPVGNNDYLSYLTLSQNDRYVVAGFTNTFDNFAEFVIFDMTLTSYNITDPNILRLDANPDCTAILPRDEAVTGLRNGDLVVWSLRTGQPSRQLLSSNGVHAHSREVKAVARSQDNKYLVSASADGTLKLWDLESERHISTLAGHNDEVWCAAISHDNEIIVSGSRDGTIRLWRLKGGQEICAFNAGVDVFYITMSHDKSTIVALGDKFGARKLIMLQVVRSKVKRQVLA